jgi:ribonuclease D
VDEGLFQQLRAWRRETAQAGGVPPFVVAHDAVLQRVAAVRPKNEAELAQIKGKGACIHRVHRGMTLRDTTCIVPLSLRQTRQPITRRRRPPSPPARRWKRQTAD